MEMYVRGRIYTYTVRASVPVSVSEPLTEFCLHYIRGSDLRSSEAMTILVACSSDHVNRRLWACALHNLRRTRTSTSKEIATCNDEFGHGRPRQKSRTWTLISVNTKHQFTYFDCIRARARMLGLRFRMSCKCDLRFLLNVTQLVNTLRLISIRHHSDTKVLDKCLIDVDLRVLAIWEVCSRSGFSWPGVGTGWVCLAIIRWTNASKAYHTPGMQCVNSLRPSDTYMRQ